MVKLYALYRGDAFVDVGTAAELGLRHGITQKSAKFMATPSHHNRTNYGALRAYLIEGGEHAADAAGH